MVSRGLVAARATAFRSRRSATVYSSSRRGLRASELNPLTRDTEENPVTLGTILLIVLVLMLVGAFPRWSHSRNWGYAPSGGLGLVLVVVVVLLLMGRI
jgi:hypothetical protein